MADVTRFLGGIGQGVDEDGPRAGPCQAREVYLHIPYGAPFSLQTALEFSIIKMHQVHKTNERGLETFSDK